LFLFARTIGLASAFPSFQGRIPNGDRVVRNGVSWPGVGHLSAAGGGSTNSFGAAFVAAGRQWTKALCEEDSDGDGHSNGLELGDPRCEWTLGAIPARATDISHPGFKDSTTSAVDPSPTPVATLPAPTLTPTQAQQAPVNPDAGPQATNISTPTPTLTPTFAPTRAPRPPAVVVRRPAPAPVAMAPTPCPNRRPSRYSGGRYLRECDDELVNAAQAERPLFALLILWMMLAQTE